MEYVRVRTVAGKDITAGVQFVVWQCIAVEDDLI